MRKLTLAVSPCPNDIFIFHALMEGLVPPPRGVSLDVRLADVEELNALAESGGADVVKVSTAAYPRFADDYVLLRAGSALGRGCGPVVVVRPDADPAEIAAAPVAVPGLLTTANLLLGLTGSFSRARLPMRYDQVMDAVAGGGVPVGVVIHEGRFTYGERGLSMYVDLGSWWEQAYGLPLPLGSIAARRDLGIEVVDGLNAAVRSSLEYARENPEASREAVRENARELSEEVIQAHIETFVTDFSLDVGRDGEHAVRVLLDEAFRIHGGEMVDPLYQPQLQSPPV
ncbi:1,4-dihydroxy-6-naphthoate synthase [Desulfohalovibrio reitneri]|uniref:1,4-dihydroxy-6-naphthoate synthase n=1 Tax=Desulfohalovibrio reitneri TaxID=1307759 RepID=UPI0004A71009|nr:1,4-dihydroxy-6-naphthoate synthase [Desulfohalovibrio reitneri]